MECLKSWLIDTMCGSKSELQFYNQQKICVGMWISCFSLTFIISIRSIWEVLTCFHFPYCLPLSLTHTQSRTVTEATTTTVTTTTITTTTNNNNKSINKVKPAPPPSTHTHKHTHAHTHHLTMLSIELINQQCLSKGFRPFSPRPLRSEAGQLLRWPHGATTRPATSRAVGHRRHTGRHRHRQGHRAGGTHRTGHHHGQPRRLEGQTSGSDSQRPFCHWRQL